MKNLSEKAKERLSIALAGAIVTSPFVAADIATEISHARRVVEYDNSQSLPTTDVSKWNDGQQSVSYGGIITSREVVDRDGDGRADYTFLTICAPRRGVGVSKLEPTTKDQEILTFGLSKYDSGRPLGIIHGIKHLVKNIIY